METDDNKARARIRIACEECRKGKRKCDGQRPTCSLCQRSGRVCCYASEASRKRKYQDDELIRSMQEEIDSLKNALRRATRGSDAHSSFELSGVVGKPSLSDSDTSVSVQPAARSSTDIRSPVAMEELASLMLKVQIEDRGEPSFTISSVQAKPRDWDTPSAVTIYPDNSIRRNSQPSFSVEYQSRQTLINCFMHSFNVYHQLLDTEGAAAIVADDHDSLRADRRFRDNALLAVASCLSSQPRRLQIADRYAAVAEADVLRCIKDFPSDLVVQGLALLAWKDLMFGAHSMAYNYIAMATGQVLHLGLHVTALISSPASTGLDQTLYRRRVRSFWAYFSIDRLVTSSLGMNCTMHWQRVKPPSFLSILPGDPTIDEMAHERFCELWHLWDSCMDQVYAFGWAGLDRSQKEALVLRSHQALVAFNQGSDMKLQFRKDNMSETVVWLHLSFHTALILIHRPLLNEPSDSTAGKFALQSATTAAASISRILRAFRKTHLFGGIAPQIIDYILTAAVIHLLNATAGRTPLGRQSANSIRTCMEALSEMQAKWGHRAQSAIRRIQELAHRWEIVWALPIQFSEPMETIDQQPLRDNLWNENFGSAVSTQDFTQLDHIALDTEVANFWESTSLPMDNDQAEDSVYPLATLDSSYLHWLFDSDDTQGSAFTSGHMPQIDNPTFQHATNSL